MTLHEMRAMRDESDRIVHECFIEALTATGGDRELIRERMSWHAGRRDALDWDIEYETMMSRERIEA